MKLFDAISDLYGVLLMMFKAEYPKIITEIAKQALEQVAKYPKATLADEILYWASYYVEESNAYFILNATSYPKAYQSEDMEEEWNGSWGLLVQQMAIASLVLDVRDKVAVLQETES